MGVSSVPCDGVLAVDKLKKVLSEEGALEERKAEALLDVCSWDTIALKGLVPHAVELINKCILQAGCDTLRASAIAATTAVIKTQTNVQPLIELVKTCCANVLLLCRNASKQLQIKENTTEDTSVGHVKNQILCVQWCKHAIQLLSYTPTECITASVMDPLVDCLLLARMQQSVKAGFSGQVCVLEAMTLLNKESLSAFQALMSFLADTPTITGSILIGEGSHETLVHVCERILEVCLKSSTDFALMSISWRSLTKIVVRDADILKKCWDAGDVLKPLLSLMESAFDNCVKLASNQTSFDKTRYSTYSKLVRFFLQNAVHLVSHYGGTSSQMLDHMIGSIVSCRSRISPHSSALTMHKEAAHDVDTNLIPVFESCVLTLLKCDGLEVETRWKVILSLEISPLHKGASFVTGRLLLLLHVILHAAELPYSLQSKMVPVLEWIFEGVRLSSVELLTLPPDTARAWSGSSLIVKCYTAICGYVLRRPSALHTDLISSLFENLLVPHVASQELVHAVWCFFVRHANDDTRNQLFKLVVDMMFSPKVGAAVSGTLSRLIGDILPFMTQRSHDELVDRFRSISSKKSDALLKIAYILPDFPLTALNDGCKHYFCRDFLASCLSVCSDSLQTQPISFEWMVLALKSMVCVLHHHSLVDTYVPAAHLRSVVQLTTRLLHLPESVSYPEAQTVVIDLAKCVCKHFSSNQLHSVLSTLKNTFRTVPCTRISIADFIGTCGNVQVDPMLQSQIFDMYVFLFHAILKDTDWMVLHAGMRNFELFAKFTSFTDVKRLLPPEAEGLIVAYLSRKAYKEEHQSHSGEKRTLVQASCDALNKHVQDVMQKGMGQLLSDKKARLETGSTSVARGVGLIQEGLRLVVPALSGQGALATSSISRSDIETLSQIMQKFS